MWASPVFSSPSYSSMGREWHHKSQILFTVHNILLLRQTSPICFQNLTVQMLVQIVRVVKQLPLFSFDAVGIP